VVHEDLVLMPEVDARRLLSGRALSFRLLAPVSPSLGVGRLRVLRVRPLEASFDTRSFETRTACAPQDDKENNDRGVLELVCGYESYERIDA